jgi:DNA-nicking Smr family endonuclease
MTTMSFGEILEAWERGRRRGRAMPASQPAQARGVPAVDMNAALDRYPPSSAELDRDRGKPAHEEAEQRGNRQPQAELDLHGLSGAEAEEALERFLREARDRGLRRVLIIHGKGHHSPGEPVLPRTVRAYLEKCPYTGAFGPADRRLGGRGATWVALRGRATAPDR